MEIKTSKELVEYSDAVSFMEERVDQIYKDQASECLWFLEHPSLYTAGTSAKSGDLLDSQFPVFDTGRGGEYTYHGPGQRVVYTMLDLRARYNQPDIKHFVWCLEETIIKTLAVFNIKGERREGRVGIWVVDQDGGENKIAAIGIRVRRWVSYHGISINLDPDLMHFSGIVPCGIREHGVTSIVQQGRDITFDELDAALEKSFVDVFGA